MKITILTNCSGGLFQFREHLLRQLLLKHSISVSVPKTKHFEELQDMGCSLVAANMDRRGINPVTDLKLLLHYLNLLRREKPDLVISYTIKPNVYGGIACQLLGISYAPNITGLGTAFQKQGALRKLVTFLYKTALRKAKVVFFENAGNMELLQSEGVVRKEQCCVLNGAGVNTERFLYTPYSEETDITRFLYLGRVMQEKGMDQLFDAMRRLNENGYPCTLEVVGVYEDDYEEQIAACAAQGWLHYHGYQKDVRPFIEQTHCVVLPSWHEGMANTNLECASMGRPVITSNIHGCREAVLDGVSGLLCEPKDTDSLYDTMVRFMEMPREAREAMGRAGRKHMEAEFDKKKVVAATLKALGLDKEPVHL